MKTLIIIIAIFAFNFASAQQTITWKGGTPGNETAWDEPRNWDSNRVPDQNDFVIINFVDNGHYSNPIIDSEVQVAWVQIYTGADLTIAETGKLIVDGAHTYSEGISFYGGNLTAEGQVVLKDIDALDALDVVKLEEQDIYYSQKFNFAFASLVSK